MELKSNWDCQFIPSLRPQMWRVESIQVRSNTSSPDTVFPTYCQHETRDVMGTGPSSRTVSSFPLLQITGLILTEGGRIQAEQKWIRGRQILDFRQTTCHAARVTGRGESVWDWEKKYELRKMFRDLGWTAQYAISNIRFFSCSKKLEITLPDE